MRVVLCVLLALVSVPVWAEWLEVGENQTIIYFIDPTTIQKDGHLRQISSLQQLKQRDSKGAISRLNLDEYDCKSLRWRTISIRGYSGPKATGTIVASSKGSDGKWFDIVPGRAGSDVLKFVCAK